MKPNAYRMLLIGIVYGVTVFATSYILLMLVGSSTWSDYATTVQMLINFLLAPAIVFTLLLTRQQADEASRQSNIASQQLQMAIEEFKRQQAKPEMELQWANKQSSLKYTIDPDAKSTSTVVPGSTICPINTGNAIALWFVIDLFVPSALVPVFSAEHPPKLVMGKGQETVTHTEFKEDFIQFSIINKGIVAAFPGYPLRIQNFHVTVTRGRKYQTSYTVNYRISGDWGAPTTGELRLELDTAEAAAPTFDQDAAST